MKYIKYLSVPFFTILVLSFISPGKRKKPTLPSKAPFGHVQSIREVSYHPIEDSSGNITKGDLISDTDLSPLHNEIRKDMMTPPVPQPIELWIYDEYGDEIENEKCHANGKLAGTETHSYFENGDVKEVIDSSFPLHNSTPTVKIVQYTYRYDTSGKLLVTNKWDYYVRNLSNPNFTRTVNFYDSIGKLREVATFNGDTMNPQSITWNTYNDKGKLVETDERRRNGNTPDLAPFEKNDFWYDKKGRLYDKATYHPREGLVKDEKITFDSTGKTITTYSYGMNRVLTGTVEKRVFTATSTIQEDTYDRDGFLTDYTITHDSAKHLMDKGVFRITYHSVMGADRRYHNEEPGDTEMVHHIINDSHFNTVEDDEFSNTGKPTLQKSFQYNYDSIGNWIAKIQFNNNKAVKIIEREIVYFKD